MRRLRQENLQFLQFLKPAQNVSIKFYLLKLLQSLQLQLFINLIYRKEEFQPDQAKRRLL